MEASVIKVAVAGAMGRMGQRILWALKDDGDFQLAYAFEREGHPDLGKEIGNLLGIGEFRLTLKEGLKDVPEGLDVLIDFTTPEATLKHIKWAVEHNVSMVIGTTGFSKEMHLKIRELGERIPCVMAPNMSVGVNLMFFLAKIMAEVLGEDFDVEIWEAHHRMKKDAPSGTALRILEVVSKALGRDPEGSAIFRAKGIIGERSKKEIGVQVIRAGDIVGEHTLLFGGIGERLELTHRAHSRDTFARGALRAAKWLVGRPKGLYDMQDVLGLSERTFGGKVR